LDKLLLVLLFKIYILSASWPSSDCVRRTYYNI